MNVTITEGVVDYLQLVSVHIELPETVYAVYELLFVMKTRMNDEILCIASYYADGAIICRSYSDLKISDPAKKRLRDVVRSITISIVEQL